jgi:hypothetical protein
MISSLKSDPVQADNEGETQLLMDVAHFSLLMIISTVCSSHLSLMDEESLTFKRLRCNEQQHIAIMKHVILKHAGFSIFNRSKTASSVR